MYEWALLRYKFRELCCITTLCCIKGYFYTLANAKELAKYLFYSELLRFELNILISSNNAGLSNEILVLITLQY